MPVPDPGGGGADTPPPQEAISVLKKNSRIICTVMVWWMFGVFWGGFECFDGPHDGYANRSNSQTSLPRAIGNPTYSRTVLLRAVG